jgi:hypothetical protein
MNTITFFPKLAELSMLEIDMRISEYRDWLDQYGDYGRLYMMNIGRSDPKNPQLAIIGIDIYDSEIAMLFKLMFEL